MRRLDLHPNKKFRGQRRRLNAFEQTLSGIAKIRLEPKEHNDEYRNWKIPAYEKAFSGKRRIANSWLKVWVKYGID